jgi:hypothetical protein
VRVMMEGRLNSSSKIAGCPTGSSPADARGEGVRCGSRRDVKDPIQIHSTAPDTAKSVKARESHSF